MTGSTAARRLMSRLICGVMAFDERERIILYRDRQRMACSFD